MAHALRYLTLGLLVLIALVPGASAQAGASDSVRTVRFTLFSARAIADVAFVARPGAGPKNVAFYPTARSPRYEYRGTMPLRFVDSVSGAVIAEAVIPPDVRDALLLFTPLASESTPGGSGLRFQIAVLDDSAARHGASGLVIINFSGLALRGTVGTQAVTLRPGLNPSLMIGRSAKITLHTRLKERTYQSYAHTLALSGAERALLILFPPFYKGSVEVQARVLIDAPPVARE